MKSIFRSSLSPVSMFQVSAVIVWRRWVQPVLEARRHRRDVEALSQLDDHQLKDIGLTRGQIETFLSARSPRDVAPACAAPHPRACDTPA